MLDARGRFKILAITKLYTSSIINKENSIIATLKKTFLGSFIDRYIPTTKVLIEQKSIDKDLRKGIRQSDGSLLNPFQQAKKYIAELPLSKHPKWVITCNFKSFLIYNMENPNGEPEEIFLKDLEKEYYRLQFIVDSENANLKKEMEIFPH